MLKSVLSLATVLLCVACGGSSFNSGGGSGGAGVGDGGQAGTSASGGRPGSGGGDSTAGGTSTGGSSTGGTSAGGSSTGGSGAGTNGGSSAGGTGGSATGGSAGSGGADCVALKADYAAAVENARHCDAGSTDECSDSSTLPAIGCGCPALVNAKSEFTTIAKQKYQAIQDAKCQSGAICNLACRLPSGAQCAAAPSAGTGFVCTSTGLVN